LLDRRARIAQNTLWQNNPLVRMAGEVGW